MMKRLSSPDAPAETVRLRLTLGVLCLALAAVASALPAIPALDVRRSDNDLLIFWAAPAGPVDGYRVYRYPRVEDCSRAELIYEGTRRDVLLADAFLDGQSKYYRVLAYRGSDLSPLTYP